MPEQAAISLRDVSKDFGDLKALDQVNLQVSPGKILGFLGPNGAGKTTTIRILTGFLRPDTGSAALLGHDMLDPGAALQGRRRMGFVPEVAALDASQTGAWLLDHLMALQGREAVDRDVLVHALELKKRDLNRPIGRLSKGTRQKINIIQGLQHRPDVLILDEPGEGLDPLAKSALFDVLKRSRERGTTIFFSSHVLAEVEALCDEVALIRDGRLGLVDHIDNVRRTMRRRVTLDLADDTDIEARLQALPTISELRRTERRWEFSVAEVQPLLALLVDLPVSDLAIEPPSLEDIFLQQYGAETGTDV